LPNFSNFKKKKLVTSSRNSQTFPQFSASRETDSPNKCIPLSYLMKPAKGVNTSLEIVSTKPF
tara:strand:- start:126 stop:314 length:189 start_codon:yes stop_codon:yes gene_type:complete